MFEMWCNDSVEIGWYIKPNIIIHLTFPAMTLQHGLPHTEVAVGYLLNYTGDTSNTISTLIYQTY